MLTCLAWVPAPAQERGPTAIGREELMAAVGALGDLDYDTRMRAGRAVRRAPEQMAVPVLLDAAREHADGYIRFKALVLLTGFADPRTADVMLEALDSPNDRLREVAFGYFEHHPDPALAPRLLAALEKETGEFVRPSLVRALGGAGRRRYGRARGAPARRQSRRGLLPRRRHRGARRLQGAGLDAGPRRDCQARRTLQDDAVLSLGKMGDKSALATLAELQRSGSQVLQPSLAAAFCLMGQNCTSHLGFLRKTLGFAEDFPGYQDLLRAAAAGLGAIGASGGQEAVGILLDVGVPSQDPVRAPVALALGLVALRDTPTLLDVLAARTDADTAIGLLAEGSTCSRKTSRKSGSSPPSAGPTGRPPTVRRRACCANG
ncbi:MAG: HEAT repeat domain-containing protein [Vicinamibacterales bacterium]